MRLLTWSWTPPRTRPRGSPDRRLEADSCNNSSNNSKGRRVVGRPVRAGRLAEEEVSKVVEVEYAVEVSEVVTVDEWGAKR